MPRSRAGRSRHRLGPSPRRAVTIARRAAAIGRAGLPLERQGPDRARKAASAGDGQEPVDRPAAVAPSGLPCPARTIRRVRAAGEAQPAGGFVAMVRHGPPRRAPPRRDRAPCPGLPATGRMRMIDVPAPPGSSAATMPRLSGPIHRPGGRTLGALRAGDRPIAASGPTGPRGPGGTPQPQGMAPAMRPMERGGEQAPAAGRSARPAFARDRWPPRSDPERRRAKAPRSSSRRGDAFGPMRQLGRPATRRRPAGHSRCHVDTRSALRWPDCADADRLTTAS